MKQPPGQAPRAATLLGFSIGLVLGPAQSLLGQDRQGSPSARDLVAISPQDREFAERFRRLLLHDREADLHAGWRLAAELGPAAGPLLWSMHRRERSNTRHRIALLAAAALAEGEAGTPRIIETVRGSDALEERVMGMLVLALGPVQKEPRPGLFADLVGRRPVAALKVAAWLACARFPGTPGRARPDAGEPGEMAAALLAGAEVAAGALRPWLERPGSRPHRDLVWRGYLLGNLRRQEAGQAPDPAALELARWLYGRDEVHLQLARRAAALLLAHVPDPDGMLDSLPSSRPPWDVLQVLASTPGMQRQLPGEWLGPMPAALDEDPRRIAVEYVLARPLAEVMENARRWGGEPRVRQAMALALARRLVAEDRAGLQLPTGLPQFPAWSWVRWAVDATAPQPVSDPPLDRAAGLAATGALPREAARRLLEEALWREGSHPGLARFEAEHMLVRDLLLTGSNPGQRYRSDLPLHERYRPKGLQSHDSQLFPVALDYYEFVIRPTPPVPERCRLR